MSKNSLDIFYFSSTHWDREWYQDFQGFRYRLVKMVNKLLDLLDTDPEFKTFHFDGQSVVLEDYSEISPENKDRLKKYISEGKILIGPWYTMPDEFNVSGESIIRNLMFGHRLCEKWGGNTWKYGYICDIFGHIAQLPQIFNGFSIKHSLLGRGTTESDPTYFKWQSPDKSYTLNYKLPDDHGYGEFNSFSYGVNADASLPLKERIKKTVDREINRSDIPIVILMDGADHADAHPDTSKFLKIISELYPDARVHHINLCEQGNLLESYADKLPAIEGELVKTPKNMHHYLHLITNTLSSYYSLKYANDECQNLIEKQTEPFMVMSQLDGHTINRSFIDLAYKYLLKNHAHDSICGCSVDRVHNDMECRFNQTKSLCREISNDYLHFSKGENKRGADGKYANILTLYNPLSVAVKKTVSVDIDFNPDFYAKYSEPFGYEDINSFKIFDCDENEVPYCVTDIKRGYVRRVYNQFAEKKDVHTVTLEVNLPPLSKTDYKIIPSSSPVRYMQRLSSGASFMENNHIKVTILENGSLEIYDKITNSTYTGLCVLSDDGEIGDGWYHTNPINDFTVFSSGGGCEIKKTEDGISRCTFTVTKHMNVPKDMVYDKLGCRRNSETVCLEFIFKISLSKDSRMVEVEMEFDNKAADHRLRLMLPTGIKSDKYFASQAFYFCERSTGMDMTTQNFRETDQYEKSTNGIVGVRDSEDKGLAFISPVGIHECSALKDGTMFLTLLRSFTKTTRTNGETRCRENKILKYKFAIAPLDKTVSKNDLLKMRDILWYTPITTIYEADENTKLTLPKSYITVSGKDISTSIIKCAQDSESAIIVRVFNVSGNSADGFINTAFEVKKAECINLNEEYISDAEVKDNKILFSLGAYKIATFKIYL